MDLLRLGTADLQGDLIVFDPAQKKHLLRSTINQFMFTAEVDGDISRADGISFLNASIVQGKYGIHVIAKADSVLVHQVPSMDVFTQAVESCAGLGFLGQGLQSGGPTIEAINELRPNLCKFRIDRGCQKTIQGDIHDRTTWKRIHDMHPTSAVLGAGFSCQPWSQLGDRGQQADSRAQVLPTLLHAAYHMRLHSLILECVPQAGQDKWVQQLIGDFCRQTGARAAQQELHLQSIFPANRSRWWCLITTAVLPPPSSFPGESQLPLRRRPFAIVSPLESK
eukprot:Skav235593  [mRNA]  locus=scaffold163:203059:203898:- [translate_table: standard]